MGRADFDDYFLEEEEEEEEKLGRWASGFGVGLH